MFCMCKSFEPWKVYQASWWMAHYGGLTPKRHIAYSNAKTVQLLDLGTLVKEVRQKLSKHAYQSTRSYKSKGRKVFSGSPFLKQTQKLGCTFLLFSFVFQQLVVMHACMHAYKALYDIFSSRLVHMQK